METDKKQLIKTVGICLLGTLMFGGAGAYLYSKTSAGIDKLKAERTYRIQEILLEKRKDITQ